MKHISNTYWLIVGLAVIAFLLRFYLLPHNLFFGPEQGRDMLVVKEIVNDRNITLIGSKTDIDGVFHGPIFYYLAAIPFALSNGNPVVISGFFIVLQAISTLLLYILGKNYFNTRTGILAALLFMLSFAAIVYSRWLSNPPLSIPVSIMFFIMIHQYLKGKDTALLWSALLFGLLVQVQFLNLVFFSGILVAILLLNIKRVIKTKKVVLFAGAGILSISSFANFILFDLRHEFLISKSLSKLLAGNSGFFTSFSHVAISIISTLGYMLSQTLLPLIDGGAFFALIWLIISLVVFWQQKKETREVSLLYIWLFVPMILLLLLRHDVLKHFFIPLLPPIVLITARLVDLLWKRSSIAGIAVCSLLCVISGVAFLQNIPKNSRIFFQDNQLQLKLSDQVAVINSIYKEAHGQPFSFQSYTIPYWWQDGWRYLFWYYGQQQYGYYPVQEKAKDLFVIIQDDPGGKPYQDDWLKKTISQWGAEKDQWRIGILTVKKLEAVR